MAAAYPGVRRWRTPTPTSSRISSPADVLVSDASSVIFEFLALDRPIVLVTNPLHTRRPRVAAGRHRLAMARRRPRDPRRAGPAGRGGAGPERAGRAAPPPPRPRARPLRALHRRPERRAGRRPHPGGRGARGAGRTRARRAPSAGRGVALGTTSAPGCGTNGQCGASPSGPSRPSAPPAAAAAAHRRPRLRGSPRAGAVSGTGGIDAIVLGAGRASASASDRRPGSRSAAAPCSSGRWRPCASSPTGSSSGWPPVTSSGRGQCAATTPPSWPAAPPIARRCSARYGQGRRPLSSSTTSRIPS